MVKSVPSCSGLLADRAHIPYCSWLPHLDYSYGFLKATVVEKSVILHSKPNVAWRSGVLNGFLNTLIFLPVKWRLPTCLLSWKVL